MHKKIIALLIVLCCLIGFGFGLSYHPLATVRAPLKVASPVSLEIPSIHVSAKVETVGLDTEGLMDVPKNPADVAWYKLGPKPGENGNAVIDGHIDTITGAPTVFAQLKNIHGGDKIYTRDANKQVHIFIVRSVKSFSTVDFPVETVFGQTQGAHLNLITCDGLWDNVAKSYTKRLVVFSTLSD